VTVEDRLAQRGVVDNEATREVEEHRARAHPGELSGAEQPGVARPAVHVQGDDVGHLEELVHAGEPPGVAKGEPLGGVVEHHRHAQCLGEHRELRADVAVADDAQHPAAHLVGAVGGLVPDPGVQGLVPVCQPSHQGDHLGQGDLDHRAGVGERCVEDRDATLGRCPHVDLVGADAEGADRPEIGGLRQDPLGHLGLGSDAQQLHAIEGGDQLVLVEGAGSRQHLGAVGAQDRGGKGVQVLQQEGA